MAKVIQYSTVGSLDALELVEIETPSAPPDGVVVEVRAAGINPIDWKLILGIRPTPPITTPRRVGSDAAGVIVEIGPDVSEWKVSDDVIVRGAAGALATHVVARPDQLERKPDSLNWDEAAAVGVPVGTAYQVLISLGVTKGTRLLIHGGSGAVGQAAIQFARAWGATVIATASESNQQRLRDLGAIPVVYGPGLVDRIRAAAPEGIDLIFDAAGTDEALEASFELVDDRQQIGTIVLGFRAAELGIRAWSGGSPIPLTAEEEKLRHEAVSVAAELHSRGQFQIEIGATYPLEKAAEALAASKSGRVRGKIVVVPTIEASKSRGDA
jgi:NADPH:quinone reductase-like Zn-dependent oxidoreductase